MTISEAKFRLYNKSPFLGTILFNLPVEFNDQVPTLGVDGFKLYVNEKYWNSLPNKQKLGVLEHECGHLFLGHIWRRGKRDDIAISPETHQSCLLWNLATDFSVNPL